MSSVGMNIVELLASDADRGADGNAGFSVHPEMQAILDRTRGSMIYDREDARVFRKLYQEGMLAFRSSAVTMHIWTYDQDPTLRTPSSTSSSPLIVSVAKS